MGGPRSNSSSSGEEDGDAEWRTAIDSVTSATTATSVTQKPNGLPSSSGGRADHGDDDDKHEPQNIKHYQIKAQKLLDDLLEKTIEVVTDTPPILEKDHALSDAGVRLFKRAPAGIVFDHVDELRGPKKRPKFLAGEELDEKSKKFRKQLQSAAVDGADIITSAKAASQKSLAKLGAKDAAFKAAQKREEERVAELKKIRGERWLPSIARQMRLTTKCKR